MSALSPAIAHAVRIDAADTTTAGAISISGDGLLQARYIDLVFSDGKIRYYRPGAGTNPPGITSNYADRNLEVSGDNRIQGRYLKSVSLYSGGGLNYVINSYTPLAVSPPQSSADNQVTLTGPNIDKALYTYLFFSDASYLRVSSKKAAATNSAQTSATRSIGSLIVTAPSIGTKTLIQVKVSGSVNQVADGYGQWGGSLQILPLDGVRALSVAGTNYNTCLARLDGKLQCNGSTFGGVYNLGAGRMVTNVTAGQLFACALLDNGEAKCAGSNSLGETGIGDGSYSVVPFRWNTMGPIDLGPGRSAKAISAGDQHMCAILDNDLVKCWGQGDYGQLGYANITNIGPSTSPAGLGYVDLGLGRTAKKNCDRRRVHVRNYG